MMEFNSSFYFSIFIFLLTYAGIMSEGFPVLSALFSVRGWSYTADWSHRRWRSGISSISTPSVSWQA